ncbi:DUF3572 domain-containing protein [Aureimonas sp. AU4]|uniref:DUF3572 domain-containing protein n=1 Tax=Aureimonas sp. AU4 TaxID=1638163 RepID=UPI000781B9A3|nr:DUF3572 domain-containing protein [Aureimonas sp. AU4]
MLEFTELRKKAGIDPQAIAIDALGFIATDPKLMNRFLDLSGIEADGIRQAAAEAGFLVGVLDFLLANEPDLITFDHATLNSPDVVQMARQKLEARP